MPEKKEKKEKKERKKERRKKSEPMNGSWTMDSLPNL
jgi:hypothetical protein